MQALAGHDAVRGKRPGKREAATPQGYCSAPLHSVKIHVAMVCYSPPDHHREMLCNKNLGNPDKFSRGFASPVRHHSFTGQILAQNKSM